jgi:hypothetical protein
MAFNDLFPGIAAWEPGDVPKMSRMASTIIPDPAAVGISAAYCFFYASGRAIRKPVQGGDR